MFVLNRRHNANRNADSDANALPDGVADPHDHTYGFHDPFPDGDADEDVEPDAVADRLAVRSE